MTKVDEVYGVTSEMWRLMGTSLPGPLPEPR